MKIEWKDEFFAGITHFDLVINGNKRGSYSIEHKSLPNPHIYKVFRVGAVPSEGEARKMVLERAMVHEDTTADEKIALEGELKKLYP